MEKFLGLLLLLSTPCAVFAKSHEDWSTWLSTTYQTDVNGGPYLAFLELAPRFKDDSSQLAQFIIRPLVGYKVTPKFQLWLGYTWQGEYDPAIKFEDATEDLMQQVQWIDHVTPELNVQYRFRLEQRFFADADPGHRMRHRIRLQYTFPGSDAYLIAIDELFLYLNSLDGSPREHSVQPGLNQNRTYAGIGYKLTPKVSLDTGYQWQYVNNFGVPDIHNHIWFTNFNVNF